MARFRFSILGIIAFVTLSAVGLAALRSSSKLWADTMLTASLAVYAAAILGAIFRRDADRAFWTGFALFGWGHLLLCFGPWLRTEIRPQLLTASLLEYLYPRLAVRPPPGAINDFGRYFIKTGAGGLVLWGPDPKRPFDDIGHCLLGLLIACLGAMLAVWLSAARSPGRRARASPPSRSDSGSTGEEAGADT